MGEVRECPDALLGSAVRREEYPFMRSVFQHASPPCSEKKFLRNEYRLYSSGCWLLTSYGTVDGGSHSPSSGRFVCPFCTMRFELIHLIDAT